MTVNLVSLERVSQRHADRLILDEISLGIDERDRVGVIGRNGSGKSTLLRILAGIAQPDSGRVVHARRLRVAYLPQDPAVPAAARLGEMLAGRQAEAIADRLGLRDLDARAGELSGGQRKRAALARVLADDVGAGGWGESHQTEQHALGLGEQVGDEIGLLVLDEPTNHLDIGAVQWLEDLLRARRGALVIVTHDRYLLDRLATRIVEVHRAAVHTHHGSYAAYLRARAERVDLAAAAERRRRNRARTELEWLQRSPKARTSKSKVRVERAEALTARPVAEPDLTVALEMPSQRLGGKVVDLRRVGKRFGQRWVLRGIDHKLAPTARIGLVGPNGAGKTTLLRLIAGDLEPDEGSVATGETVVVGFYGQEPEPLAPGRRVFDVIAEDVSPAAAKGLLERFGFEAGAQRGLIGELSGGERRRLELLRVLAIAPNLLLLDEPTNDLDLDTLGELEDYLDGWPGAFVVATHDRYLLDRVCRDVYALDPDGSLRHVPGGWAAYAAERSARAGSPRPRGASPARREGKSPASPRALTHKERHELDALGTRLPELENRKAELAAALQREGDYARAQVLGERLATVLAEIDAAETRWLELAEVPDAG